MNRYQVRLVQKEYNSDIVRDVVFIFRSVLHYVQRSVQLSDITTLILNWQILIAYQFIMINTFF